MTLYTDPLASLIYEGKRARLPDPCIYCGAQEKWNPDEERYENIVHDFSKHPGFTDRASYKVDETTLDKLGGRREA